MCRAESIVHVPLGQISQCTGKNRIVGFLAGIEAQVLEQPYLAWLQAPRHRLGLRAHDVTHVVNGPS
ncbi:hypothetical protein HRbin27_01628 [bacterium HR27]|nr:hypothetical protein HRbin27_01628 [bacterium HR27]